MPNVYLIHGFIGAGKTTFAKRLAEETGALRFTLDVWMESLYGKNPPADRFPVYESRVKGLILELTHDLVQKEQDVILDFGFWKKVDRSRTRDQLRSWGAKDILFCVTCARETMKARACLRTAASTEGDGALFIDAAIFDSLWGHFEPVDEGETHHVIRTDCVSPDIGYVI